MQEIHMDLYLLMKYCDIYYWVNRSLPPCNIGNFWFFLL